MCAEEALGQRAEGTIILNTDILLGASIIIVCMTVQCIVVSGMLRILFFLEIREYIRPTLLRTSFILVVALILLFGGNLLQVSIWAALFLWLNEFQTYGHAFYHSTVNFTTLGYGDMVMSDAHRLLGALEAANGVLMFGLTTGFLYSILNLFMRRAWQQVLPVVE